MKHVLITGAGQGLGLCLVKAHRAQGDRVFALDRRISRELEALSSTDEMVDAFETDITSTQSVEAAMDRVAAKTQSLDVIYNNAGVYYRGGQSEGMKEILDCDLDDMLDMYNINAIGALRVSKAALKHGLLHAGATICNTSSEAGGLIETDAVRTFEYGYCMSKCALNKASTLLYNDIERKGMRVICMQPGWMRTQMGGPAAAASSMSVAPEDTARGFLKFTNDFHSTSREHMFFRATGEPMAW